MQHLLEILEGYCHPLTRTHAVSVIGENGLNIRLWRVFYYERVHRGLIRPQCWQFGKVYAVHVFNAVFDMTEAAWITEVLRIMDKGRTGNYENMTIRLFHERFQAEPRITIQDKKAKLDAYNKLDAEYARGGYEGFRNKVWAHLDLTVNVQQNLGLNVTMHDLTSAMREWYKVVSRILYNTEPVFVTEGSVCEGRRFVRQLHRMMVGQIRLLMCRGLPIVDVE